MFEIYYEPRTALNMEIHNKKEMHSHVRETRKWAEFSYTEIIDKMKCVAATMKIGRKVLPLILEIRKEFPSDKGTEIH